MLKAQLFMLKPPFVMLNPQLFMFKQMFMLKPQCFMLKPPFFTVKPPEKWFNHHLSWLNHVKPSCFYGEPGRLFRHRSPLGPRDSCGRGWPWSSWRWDVPIDRSDLPLYAPEALGFVLNGNHIYPLVNSHSYGKSQFLMGKSSINGHFQ